MGDASTALAASDTRRSEDRSSITRESDPDSLGGPKVSLTGPETAAPLLDDKAGSDALDRLEEVGGGEERGRLEEEELRRVSTISMSNDGEKEGFGGGFSSLGFL